MSSESVLLRGLIIFSNAINKAPKQELESALLTSDCPVGLIGAGARANCIGRTVPPAPQWNDGVVEREDPPPSKIKYSSFSAPNAKDGWPE